MVLPGDLPPALASTSELDRWLPHRPPWLRIDSVSALEGDRVVAQKRISANDPLVGGGLGGFLVLDLAAQAAACLMAARSPGQGGHLGYLVAAQGWKFHRLAIPGETLTLEVTRQAELGPLVRFAGTIRVGEFAVAEGEFTCAIRPSSTPPQPRDQGG
jgi:3-hydroxyacyl-[acyl-carrier-protein] dehydratase